MTTKVVAKKPTYAVSSTSMANTISLIGPTHRHTQAPVVYYAPNILETIHYIVQKCPQEVGWLGTVERMGYDYLITSIYLPEQEVTGTETDISGETLAKIGMEMLEEGKDPDTLYYWGHSHVNMGVSPSGQDESMIAEYLEAGCKHFIRGIYNKAGAAKVDVYDTQRGLVFQCVKHETFVALEETFTDKLDGLIKANVKKQLPAQSFNSYPYNGYQSQSYGGYQSQDQSRNHVKPTRTFVGGRGAAEYMAAFNLDLDLPEDEDDITNEAAWNQLGVNLREH